MDKEVIKIYDGETELELEIIGILASTKDWVTTTTLMEKTGLGQKAILKHMQKIAEDIEKFTTDSTFVLHSSKGKGYFLETGEDTAKRELFFNLLSDKFVFKLLMAIFYEKLNSPVQFAADNFISEATLARKIKVFKEVLGQYDLKIEKHESYQIVGPEIQIRLLSHMTFWRYYEGAAWPFPMIDKELVDSIANRAIAFFDCYVNEIYRQKIQYIIGISLLRSAMGHRVALEEVFSEETLLLGPNEKFRAHMHSIMPPNLKNNEEMDFLYLYLLTYDRVFADKAFKHEFFQTNKAENTFFYQSIVSVIESAQSKYDYLDLEEDIQESILNALASGHIFSLLFPHYWHDMSGLNFWNQMKSKFSHLKGVIALFIEELAEKTGNPLFINQEFLNGLYLNIATFIDNTVKEEPEITILMVTELSSLEEVKISKRLQRVFSMDYNLNIIKDQDANENDQIDIVFATNDMKKSGILTKNQKEFIFVDEFGVEDMKEIAYLLREIRKTK